MTDGAQLITTDDLGAWLIKGNADHADLCGRFARQPRVDRWCVRRSYRLELMAAGQPVLFWGSGSRRREVMVSGQPARRPRRGLDPAAARGARAGR